MYTIVNDDEVLVGSIVAERYHVRDVIGQGSAGTVFGTEHLAFGRQAAMKVLRPRYTSLDTIRHVFQSETRVALAVAHPSLCDVFDIGTLPDGAPFYMMERLHGETLAKRITRERFSAAAAVDMMMQLLAAMDALHERQILLRDLRPQNIFLANRRGCRPIVKVLDVGLSRVMPLDRVQLEWDAVSAAAGSGPVSNEATGLLSIPYYLSPERARGDHKLDPTSDVFVAAVILYEALTGQRPFAGRTWAGLVQQIAGGQAPRLELLRPDLPEDLGALIARCLAHNPAVRPPSARALQDELRAAFENPRRGSTSSQVAAVAVPLPVEEGEPETDHDAFDEETRTDRNRIQFASFTSASGRPAAVATSGAIDEASADSPSRTVRPPAPPRIHTATMVSAPDIEVDVELEPPVIDDPVATRRGSELEATLDIAWPAGARPSPSAVAEDDHVDEETATMQLNPELRARVEQLTKRAASPEHASSRPPPTHPIRPPRQR